MAKSFLSAARSASELPPIVAAVKYGPLVTQEKTASEIGRPRMLWTCRPETIRGMAELLTEPLRRRHADLRPRLVRIAEIAGLVPELDVRQRAEAISEVLAFLRGELQLHAEAEEQWLYPKIARELRHPQSTASMAFDHDLVREHAAALESADVNDIPALQAELYSLYALLDAHFRKEEQIYLPLLEYERESDSVAAIEEAMGRHERGEPAPVKEPNIDLTEHDFPTGGLAVEQLAYLARYAVQAPSSHNSQPWLFRFSGDALELLADRTRALPVVDPDDRELVMSCGAALFMLRTAVRHFGFEDDVEVLPDQNDPDLLARIRLGERRRPTHEEKLLFWAIAARHTNRNAFEHREVPAGTALRAGARCSQRGRDAQDPRG